MGSRDLSSMPKAQGEEKILKVVLTEFARYRHFENEDFAGTRVTDRDPETFERELQEIVDRKELTVFMFEGYAPFCKHMVVLNWTDTLAGAVEITPENERFLRSSYEARQENELPVLGRYFEGLPPEMIPKAKYLCMILYDKDQLAKEEISIDGDYGIVAILGQSCCMVEPMSPITMMRNALGINEGGSGVALDREEYMKSVEFWSRHAVVKSS